MLPVAPTVVPAATFRPCAAPRASTTTTEDQRIRMAAADLFRQGRLAEADLLTYEALQQYPDSEDVLVMRALICEVRHDWAMAASVLERLVRLQGQGAPAETWCHWVRVLRCQGHLERALAVATEALSHHPLHTVLTTEQMEIGQTLAGQTGSTSAEPLRQAA
jgi:hypothetical protein